MTNDYAGLSAAERRRLERFAVEFGDIDPADYEQFAGTTTSADEIAAVRDVANQVIGSGTRRTATKNATKAFIEAIDQAIRGRWGASDILFGSRSFGSRPEDRARLLGSVERAVVALILWDELTDGERGALAGPWAQVVERALAT